jgi:hypothetical protein
MRDAGMKPTQTGAGKLIGITQPSVNEWVGGAKPSMENAIDLATKLNVCVEWLLTERGPKRPVPQDATAQGLWDLWPRLDDVTKGLLLGTAQGRLQQPSDEDEDTGESTRQSLSP